MNKKRYCVLLIAILFFGTSCSVKDVSTKESMAKEILEDGHTFIQNQEKIEREIRYTAEKDQYQVNEKAIILEDTIPVIEITAKKAKGKLYTNSKNKYTYIAVEIEFENKNYSETFDILSSNVWLVDSKKQMFKQGQGGIEHKAASKGEKGFYKSTFSIGELIELGDTITIRYEYDLTLNGGGSGPFNYIEFEVPIELLWKEKLEERDVND